MRFAYACVAMFLWGVFITIFEIITANGINLDTLIISFAIVVAGAMAGGDGN